MSGSSYPSPPTADQGDANPLSFDSKTLMTVIFLLIFVVTFFPVAWVVWRVVKDCRIERRARKKAAAAHDDLEKGRPTTPPDTAMIDGAEINGGVCELEQPGLPELQGVGRAELWDEWCAGEICGGEVRSELDAADPGGEVVWEKMYGGGEGGDVKFVRVMMGEVEVVVGVGVAEMQGEDGGGRQKVEEEEEQSRGESEERIGSEEEGRRAEEQKPREQVPEEDEVGNSVDVEEKHDEKCQRQTC